MYLSLLESGKTWVSLKNNFTNILNNRYIFQIDFLILLVRWKWMNIGWWVLGKVGSFCWEFCLWDEIWMVMVWYVWRYDYWWSRIDSFLQFEAKAPNAWHACHWLRFGTSFPTSAGAWNQHWSCLQCYFCWLDDHNLANYYFHRQEPLRTQLFIIFSLLFRCPSFDEAYLCVYKTGIATKALLKGVETWKKETIIKKVLQIFEKSFVWNC